MFKELFLLGTGILATNVMVSHIIYHTEKTYLFEKARAYCASVNKPLLNIGAGNNPAQIGDINVDIFPTEESILPNYQQASADSLPFPDKTFGAATAFHVVEHLDDPKAALSEMNRVADRTYVSVPAPFDILTDAGPWGHKYTFYYGDMQPNNPLARILIVGGVMGSLYYMYLREKKNE